MTDESSNTTSELAGFSRAEWVEAHRAAGCSRQRASDIVQELFATAERLGTAESFPLTPTNLYHLAAASADARERVLGILRRFDGQARAALFQVEPRLGTLFVEP